MKRFLSEKNIVIWTIIIFLILIISKIFIFDQVAKNSIEYKTAQLFYSKWISKISPYETPFNDYITNYETILLIKRSLEKYELLGSPKDQSNNCPLKNFSHLDQTKQELIESCHLGLFKGFFKDLNLTKEAYSIDFVIILANALSTQAISDSNDAYDFLLSKNYLITNDRELKNRMITRKEVYTILSKIINNWENSNKQKN